MYSVVAVTGNGDGGSQIPVILVETHVGGYYLHIHTQGVHVGNTLLWRPGVSGVPQLSVGGGHAMPGYTLKHIGLKALGGGVGVYVNAAHMYLLSFPD
jgi:hypothetical protein